MGPVVEPNVGCVAASGLPVHFHTIGSNVRRDSPDGGARR